MSPVPDVPDALATALSGALLILLATVALGLLRALRGPTLEDRLASILLIGTGGVAFLLLLGVLLPAPAMFDVALLLALLAAVATAAVTRPGGRSP